MVTSLSLPLNSQAICNAAIQGVVVVKLNGDNPSGRAKAKRPGQNSTLFSELRDIAPNLCPSSRLPRPTVGAHQEIECGKPYRLESK